MIGREETKNELKKHLEVIGYLDGRHKHSRPDIYLLSSYLRHIFFGQSNELKFCRSYRLLSACMQDKPKILYQINDQEFLGMNTGSLEDVAEEVSKELAKEKVLFQPCDFYMNIPIIHIHGTTPN